MKDFVIARTNGQGRLTEKADWDDEWSKISLPSEVKRIEGSWLNELLYILDKYLPKNDDLSILEIGGAPGGFLVYMYKNFGYKIHAVDYSDTGCIKMKDNFNLLNIPVTISQKDIFSKSSNNLIRYDIVYSLGFIEHFTDLNMVVQKHRELLKPGGILLIGAPNFLGINYFFLKRLAPKLLSKHNLPTMDISNWKRFENKFNLKPLFRGYLFVPNIFGSEKKTTFNKIIETIWRIVDDVFYIVYLFRPFRKLFNSKYVGDYVIGVYKKQ